MLTQEQAFKVLGEKNWSAETSVKGLWAVGPEIWDGKLNILGMGPSIEEATEMALRSNYGETERPEKG